jgi:uncharacterized protein with GYD domain
LEFLVVEEGVVGVLPFARWLIVGLLAVAVVEVVLIEGVLDVVLVVIEAPSVALLVGVTLLLLLSGTVVFVTVVADETAVLSPLPL